MHFGGMGALGSTTRIMRILSGEISNNAGFGVHADANVSVVTIGEGVMIHSNNGSNSNPQNNILTPYYDEKETIVSAIAESDTLVSKIWANAKALTVAKFIGLK